MSGSREIHAPFSPDQWAGVAPPTGLLWSRYLHTRVIKETNMGGSWAWLARVDGSSFSPGSRPVLFSSLAWSSGARAWIFVALVSGACLTCCFWSGARLRPAVPILGGRDGARAHFCHDPVRTSGPKRDDAQREVATPFLFSFIWVLCKCLWEGACGE